jgi:hypothetical protein
VAKNAHGGAVNLHWARTRKIRGVFRSKSESTDPIRELGNPGYKMMGTEVGEV